MEVHEDNAVLRLFEERLGFPIEWEERASASYREFQMTALASGDYPDIMEFQSQNIQTIREMVEDGVLKPLNDLLDKYGANVKKARPADVWFKPLDDGMIYSIPTRYNQWGAEHAVMIRTDWLKKVGLSMPNNPEELYDVLYAFTFEDPDGNGKDDTYGTNGVGSPKYGELRTTRQLTGSYFGIYGCTLDGRMWSEIDGKIVHLVEHPDFLDLLKFERRLFQDGLVDPEFALMPRATWLDKIYAGAYGVWHWPFTHLDVTSQWWAGLTQGIPGIEDKFAWVPPFPSRHDGVRRHVERMRMRPTRFESVIFADSKDPQPKRAMQLVDYLATEEGSILAAFGEEGVHYTWEGRNLSVADMTEDERRASGTYVYSWFFRRNNILPINDLHYYVKDNYLEYVEWGISIPPTETFLQYGAALDDLARSRINAMLTTENVDIDAAYKEFVSEWYNMGGRDWVREANEYWANKK